MDGGPNHLKNLCDANIVVDADGKLGTGSPLIKQASFYYMGHFSRYIRPGMRRVGLSNTVETEAPPLAPADIKNGVALAFVPCEAGNAVQLWTTYGEGNVTIVAQGTADAPGSDGYMNGGECVEHCISGECWFPKVQLWACGTADPLHGGRGNQQWRLVPLAGGAGVQVVNPATAQCLTAVERPGWAVGLDPGVTVVAAQAFPCLPAGAAPNQTFTLVRDADGVAAFAIRSAMNGQCLQPELERLPHFDAVAFEDPDSGAVVAVVMNTRDQTVELTLRDEAAGAAVEVAIPPHSITTYRWAPGNAAAESASASAAQGVPTGEAAMQLAAALAASSGGRGPAFALGLAVAVAALAGVLAATIHAVAPRRVGRWAASAAWASPADSEYVSFVDLPNAHRVGVLDRGGSPHRSPRW